ncbi:hypothetical protein [Maridesulfovibrio hydrothermalis]|uniref:Uncharacterized protein n=1 Tax=Maridesulfovibrio hydrothermalis AM13 = DSM 14728 TaxID=1121451 RepID=L0RH39_9BACT|nr:hypothetical protein [Maridesulfovibrio hydrothermalis]CCO25525.1 conserved protein of unknown function [Maridesulfovibrio hydrothermalis AM13 = DSM 14728]
MATVQSVKCFLDRHYDTAVKNRCNTCNVGTWAINRKQSSSDNKERGFFLKTFLNRFRTKDQNSAAAQLKNDEVVDALSKSTRPGCKILVVSKGNSFSGNVVNYAVEMAAKTRSSLVALNLDEQGTNFSEFQAESKDNISSFSAKANEAGLLFAHIVKKGAEDSVVAELHCKDSEFRYVMEDVATTKSTKQAIPVYAHAMLRVK